MPKVTLVFSLQNILSECKFRTRIKKSSDNVIKLQPEWIFQLNNCRKDNWEDNITSHQGMKEVIQPVQVHPFLVLHSPVEGISFFSYDPCVSAWATMPDSLFHTFIILCMKKKCSWHLFWMWLFFLNHHCFPAFFMLFCT